MFAVVEKVIREHFSLKKNRNLESNSDSLEKSDSDPLLILALSGGPDSMALFWILKKLKEKYAFRMVSAHVNHMFRGTQADEEEEYLKSLAEREGEILETLRLDVGSYGKERKLSPQAAGHQIRREFFLRLAKKYGGEFVALAHHKDDRVESFFINLFHGAGSQGLTALSQEDDYELGIKVIRPFISCTKDEILEFCRRENIFYFKDPSNEKPVYKRNKIRLELIPNLEKEYNPKIREAVSRSVEILEAEDELLKELAAREYERLVREGAGISGKSEALITLDKKEFKKIHEALQRRVLLMILQKMEAALSWEKMEKVRELLKEEKGQREYKLSRNAKLLVSYESGEFVKSGAEPGQGPEEESIEIEIDLEKIEKDGPLTIQARGQSFTFEAEGTFPIPSTFPQPRPCGKPEAKRNVPSDSAEIFAESVTLRTRREGDIIKPAGGKTKKLKKFLMEKKIPSSQRDDLLLLASGNEVIWIPDLVISGNFLSDCVRNKNNLEQSGKKMLKVAWTREREFEK